MTEKRTEITAGRGLSPGRWLVNDIYWSEEAIAARPHAVGEVRFIDCTLTEGDDCVGHQLNFNTRLELMRRLDAIGVGEITLPSHARFEEEVDLAEAYRKAGCRTPLNFKGPGIPIPLDGAWQERLKRTVEYIGPDTLSPAFKYPQEDYFSDFTRGLTKEQVSEEIAECVAFAKTLGVKVVPWFLEMRIKPDTVAQFCVAARDAGVDGVYMVDSRGNCSPVTAKLFIETIRRAVGDDVDIYVQHHNDIGMSTANALASAEGGANWIDASVLGISERGGCISLEEAAVVLEMYGISTGINLEGLYELGLFTQKAFGVDLAPWKPLIGESWNKEEGWGHMSYQHAPIPGLEGDLEEFIGIGVAPKVIGRQFESVIGSKILFGTERSSALTDHPVFLYELAEKLGFTLSSEEMETIMLRARAAVATSYRRHYLTFDEFALICEGVVGSPIANTVEATAVSSS